MDNYSQAVVLPFRQVNFDNQPSTASEHQYVSELDDSSYQFLNTILDPNENSKDDFTEKIDINEIH